MKYKAFFCGELSHEFSDEDQEAMDFMNRQLDSPYNDGIWEFEDEDGNTMFPTCTQHEYRSSTNGDYGPGNPWDAPGMSISDYI